MISEATLKALRHIPSRIACIYDTNFLDKCDAFLYLFIVVVSLYHKINIEEVL
jgi:hypothetical protein